MLNSMTAFARQDAQANWGHATWEVKTVNHRYLEVSLRLPELFRDLEMSLRQLLKKYLRRGKVDITLKYSSGELAPAKFVLDKVVAKQLGSVMNELDEYVEDSSAVDKVRLLSWPGLLKQEPIHLAEVQQALLAAFEETLSKLQVVRQTEGTALQALLVERIHQIRAQLAAVHKRLPEVLELVKARLSTKLSDLSAQLDRERLEQEMVYFTNKADVAEEVDRLQTHLDEFERIVGHSEPVGRRMDFLLQEVNREINTLAAKSADAQISQATVNMKVLAEQMREQVQNIE